jgi:hypothetical protein
MQGEFNYGNDGLGNRIDVYASSESYSSAPGPQENSEINSEEKPIDINNSNTRLDKYLFYFTSRL